MIEHRFRDPLKPRDWFLVPLQVIDDAVMRIRDGSIVSCEYDPAEVKLVSLTRR